MREEKNHFNPIDAQLLYSVSQVTWKATSFRSALEDLVKIIRPAFIFDNLVLYLIDPITLNLDVAYAKATGRGKSAEADVAWGEILGSKVIEEKKTIVQEPWEPNRQNRLDLVHALGLPLQSSSESFGALIFIRFGGPVFGSEEVKFAEYLANQITNLIAMDTLKKERDRLEFQYRSFQVQEDFISTLSHELRNPLGFIKGYTTTLLRPDITWEPETQLEFLNIIDAETDRLQDLIANLLDSARLHSGQIVMNFQTVRLDGLIHDIITRNKLHHPDMDIQLNLTPPIKAIQADPRRLTQVFENILGNASKYAPGSPISITIEEMEKGVNVDIKDHGPGIPEKYISRIFDRFFRVPDNKPNVHGSGLGLFICKQIIQAHSGVISITSNLGEGTTFHIYLPENP